MTEVAIRASAGTVAVPVEPSTAAVVTLADWASELDAAGQIAAKLCLTPFVPRHFQGKPADAAAAILTGHELGLSPMASLRSIFMISGTPGMYAKSMVAVVQAQGHEVWVDEQSADRVVVCGRRRGSDHVFRTVWDRERVVKAKLNSNAKYQETPQQMMVARGQAEICRQVAADALHGIPYTVEELLDEPPSVRVEAAVGVPPRVTVAEILGGDRPQDPQATVDNDEAGPALMTKVQSDEMFSLLTAAGYATKQEALDFCTKVVGRPVAARAELTFDEAEAVNARLRAADAGPEPVVEESPVGEPEGPASISTKQRNHIMALATELGLADRQARLDYCSGVTGHDVASTNDLSAAEASAVIEEMLAAKAVQDARDPAPEPSPLAAAAARQSATLQSARRGQKAATPDEAGF